MKEPMSINTVYQEIKKKERPVAILLGNGINLYFQIGQSWYELLHQLYEKFLLTQKPDIGFNTDYFNNFDISPTEFYDIIESYNLSDLNEENILQQNYPIKRFMQSNIAHWAYKPVNVEKLSFFIKTIVSKNIPILTTNYDNFLINSAPEIFSHHKKENRRYNEVKISTYKPFYINKFLSDIYPLNNYYSSEIIKDIENIENNFAVWHIHGMINYFRSLRIGQNDYFHFIKKLTNKIDYKHLIKEGNLNGVKYTWLKIFFTSDLIILGLRLEYSDYVLRWLLNERFKFNKFNKKNLKTYFVYKSGVNQGRNFLFNMLDIDLVKVENYKAMYENFPKKLKYY